jgi:hypothetical protein
MSLGQSLKEAITGEAYTRCRTMCPSTGRGARVLIGSIANIGVRRGSISAVAPVDRQHGGCNESSGVGG